MISVHCLQVAMQLIDEPHPSEFAVVSGPKKFDALAMNKNEPSSVMNTASPKEGKRKKPILLNIFCSLEFYYIGTQFCI